MSGGKKNGENSGKSYSKIEFRGIKFSDSTLESLKIGERKGSSFHLDEITITDCIIDENIFDVHGRNQ